MGEFRYSIKKRVELLPYLLEYSVFVMYWLYICPILLLLHHATHVSHVHRAHLVTIPHHHLFYHFWGDYYSIDWCVSKVVLKRSWIRSYRRHFVLCYLYCSLDIGNRTFAHRNGS